MPLPWTRSGRQVQRMHQIADVLLRHGLGYVAAQIGLPVLDATLAPTPSDGLPARCAKRWRNWATLLSWARP